VNDAKVTIYTDPGCPFGFNAQRQETQLLWHYGHGLEITRRMIVLTEKTSTLEALGLTREMIESNVKRLRAEYGMPMLIEPRDRVAATIEACRAYVGARLNESGRADLLLRALRRRAFSDGQALDDMETLHGATDDAGMAPAEVDAWLADPGVEAALREDMAATRAPLPEALALAHRLSRSQGGLRYSTASAVFEAGERRVVMPGFQPFAVYEVAVANVAPELERRPAPTTVEDILAWAPYALATAEVAELRGVGLDEARAELEESGAAFAPVAGDGYWSALTRASWRKAWSEKTSASARSSPARRREGAAVCPRARSVSGP
jgi:predicted DsbA family dithiol-disulfide isomerase